MKYWSTLFIIAPNYVTESYLNVQALVCMRLTTETVECLSLSLEGIHNVERGDSLALGVLSVCNGITNDRLEEDLEDTACLLIDEARDTLDATTASETTDCWFCDALDVVTQNLAMTLRTSLSESLSTFTTARHCLRIKSC
jgi:hypothetical protein